MGLGGWVVRRLGWVEVRVAGVEIRLGWLRLRPSWVWLWRLGWWVVVAVIVGNGCLGFMKAWWWWCLGGCWL